MFWLGEAKMVDDDAGAGIAGGLCATCSRRPRQARLTGKLLRPAARSTRLIPGSTGACETLSYIKMRVPTLPAVFGQSSIVSPTPGSFGSTGTTRRNRSGWAV